MTKELLNNLFRYAYSLTHNEEQAYDLVSHGVEKMMGKVLVLNKTAYLKRSIRNKFYDEKRKMTEESIETDEECSLQDLEKEVIDQNHIKEILSSLLSDERELLYLWAVEGYSLGEISRLQNTPRGTLTSKLSRIKKKIRAMDIEVNHE